MNVQEYLKQCSVKSVDKLSDEQVVAFFNRPDVYIGQRCAVRDAFAYYKQMGISKDEIFRSLRKSMEGAVEFRIYLVSNESAYGPTGNETRWVIEP